VFLFSFLGRKSQLFLPTADLYGRPPSLSSGSDRENPLALFLFSPSSYKPACVPLLFFRFPQRQMTFLASEVVQGQLYPVGSRPPFFLYWWSECATFSSPLTSEMPLPFFGDSDTIFFFGFPRTKTNVFLTFSSFF